VDSKPGSEPRPFTQVELEDDGWVMHAEPVGPNCPFGHPWRATERIAQLEDALRGIKWQAGSTPSKQVLGSIVRRCQEALGEQSL